MRNIRDMWEIWDILEMRDMTNVVNLKKWLQTDGGTMQNLEMLSHLKSLYTRCPKKKCELLLVIVAVIHTFFWDTLYMVATAKTHPLIYSKFHMICLFYLSLPGVIADVNYQKVTLFTQSNKSFGHCKNISLNITVQ